MPMIPGLLLLAIDFNRSPLRYALLGDSAYSLPCSFGELLREMGAALTRPRVDDTARHVGLTSMEVQEIARFFLRHVLLISGADHYRVLGVSRDADAEIIREHYHLLIRLFHPDRIVGEEGLEEVESARLNVAYHILRDAERRAHYDAELAASGLNEKFGELTREAFVPNYCVATAVGDWGGRRTRSQGVRIARMVGGGVLGVVVTFALALLVLPARPVLRIPLDRVPQPAPLPAYLGGGVTEGRGLVDGRVATGNRVPKVGDGGRRLTGSGVQSAADRTTDAQARPEKGQSALGLERNSTKVSGVTSFDEVADGARVPTLGATAGALDGSSLPAGSAETDKELRLRSDEAVRYAPESSAMRVDQGSSVSVSQEGAGMTFRMRSASRRDAVHQKREITHEQSAGTAVNRGVQPKNGLGASRGSSVSSKRDGSRQDDQLVSSDSRSRSGAQGTGLVSNAFLGNANSEKIISDFEAAYEAGNVGQLAGLFALDAVINEGAGRAFIRAHYADFFRQVPQRSLLFGAMHWFVTAQDLVVGEGSVHVGAKARGAADWRRASGTIRFELASSGDGYRIQKMIYDLGSK